MVFGPPANMLLRKTKMDIIKAEIWQMDNKCVFYINTYLYILTNNAQVSGVDFFHKSHDLAKLFKKMYVHVHITGCQGPQEYYIFRIGDSYKPSFVTVTGRGPHPIYTLQFQKLFFLVVFP